MRKAIVIDDDFARPSSTELQRYADGLRQFLTDHGGCKQWMDKEFGLSGDHRRGDYFDPLFESQSQIERFWALRDTGPAGAALSNTVFPELVKEIEAAQAPLKKIYGVLTGRGWTVKKHAALPSNVEDICQDTSLIVLDYVLNRSDPAYGLESSKKFIKKFLRHARQNSEFSCPYIVLISALPNQASQNAPKFRQDIGIQGAFFRFSAKTPAGIVDGFDEAIVSFENQQSELESYRRFHARLVQVASSACRHLRDSIRDMELQDLATLHAGQLVQEGEALSDYLAWLYGQVITAQFLQDFELTKHFEALPKSSHDVLLGHLRPTENIQKMFASFSLTRWASASHYKEVHGLTQVRAGDLFQCQSNDNAESAEAVAQEVQGAESAASQAGSPCYVIVVSQDCDLLQCKITNGQVLCVEGTGRVLESTEVDLLRATIRQMDNKGVILIRDQNAYVQIEWRSKDLRTVNLASLQGAQGYRYLGRINGIYALEAQHSALNELARIGVPIQPSYSVYFGSVYLRVFRGKAEVTELADHHDTRMIVAVLRNEKSGSASKQRILLANALKEWLVQSLTKLSEDKLLPPKLKKPFEDLADEIKSISGWSLLVKEESKKGLRFSREKLNDKGVLEAVPLPPEFKVLLKDVFESTVADSPRLEIEFRKI